MFLTLLFEYDHHFVSQPEDGYVLRMLLFMLGLVVFVNLCGIAWRVVPYLRNIASVQPKVEKHKPARTINLSGAVAIAAKESVIEPVSTPPVVTLTPKAEAKPVPLAFLNSYQARSEAVEAPNTTGS